MREFKISGDLVLTMRKLLEELVSQYREARELSQKHDAEAEEILGRIRGLEAFLGKSVEDILKDSNEAVHQRLAANKELFQDINELPLWEAALLVLRSQKRPMNAEEIYQILLASGRKMGSEHSLDMVSGALRKSYPALLKRRRKGHSFVYSLKQETNGNLEL